MTVEQAMAQRIMEQDVMRCRVCKYSQDCIEQWQKSLKYDPTDDNCIEGIIKHFTEEYGNENH